MKFAHAALPALLLSGLMAAQLPAQAPASPAPAAASSPIDLRATAALDASRAYLRSLRSFEVRADATFQDVLDDGTKVDLKDRVRYEYRAPDRLFIAWQSDRNERRLYYDGRTVSVFAPAHGYYARFKARGDVSDLLQRAATNYGIVFPLPDLFLWASSDAPPYNVERAVYIGPARIAGADTDHFLFRQGDVDWQVWFQRGERPVPRKIVITDRSEPAQPSFSALLQWNPDVQLPDSRFEFTPPEGAARITIAKLSKEKGR